MYFRLLVIIAFTYSSCFASSVESNCRESLLPDLSSPFDAYASFLRYHPTQTSTSELFQAAKTDLKLRTTLNHSIEADGFLKNASHTGIQFQQWASTFTQNHLTFGEPSIEALSPWSHLESEFQDFLRTLEAKKDRPMPEIEAEKRARIDTANRFGITQDFSITNPLHGPEVSFYFKKRTNFYLNQEIPVVSLNRAKQEERFRYWLSKKIQRLELERAENLKALLFETEKTLKRPLIFEYRKRLIRVPNYPYGTTFDFLSEKKVKISYKAPEKNLLTLHPVAFGSRQDLPFYRQVVDFSSFYVPYSRASAAPENVTLTGETEATLVFTVTAEDLKPVEAKLRSAGVSTQEVQELQISVSEIIDFIKLQVKKSTYPGELLVSSQVQARLEYEVQLREKVSELKSEQGRTNLIQFGHWTSTRAEKERAYQQNSTVETGMIDRLRALPTGGKVDSLAGLEWFGYAIHPDYWRNRDTLLNQNTTLPGQTLISDFWDKSRTITRTAIIYGALVSTTVGALKIIDLYKSQFPYTFPKEVRIGESDEPRDSFSGDGTDNTGNGPDTLFTVTSERINRKDLYQREPVEELPDNFNHGTIADLRDPSDLIDITSTIPHTIWNLNAFDTISRQTLRIDTKLNQVPADGYLFLPTPEGYELVFLDRASDSDSVRIFQSRQTGTYFLKIEKSSYASFTFRAGYAKTKPHPDPTEVLDRISSLNRDRIKTEVMKIKEAGLLGLANDLETLLLREGPISAADLAETISRGQRYSTEPGRGWKWIYYFTDNPYSQFQRYLRDDDLLYLKCDIANHLYQILLREVLGPSSPLILRPVQSYVYQRNHKSSTLIHEIGHVGTIGHARTQILYPGIAGRVILDATPSNEGTPDETPEAVAENGLIETHRQKNPFKGPNAPLPRPITPELDIRGEIERLRKLQWHQDWVDHLERATEVLLESPAFQALIKTHSQDYLPPQRTFILAKRVLAFAKGEEEISELRATLGALFHADFQQIPTRVSHLSQKLKAISAQEKALWAACSNAFNQRKNREFFWTQDATLKKQVDEILEILGSYSWTPPRD